MWAKAAYKVNGLEKQSSDVEELIGQMESLTLEDRENRDEKKPAIVPVVTKIETPKNAEKPVEESKEPLS